METTNHNETLTLPVLVKAGDRVLLKAGDKPQGDWVSYNEGGRLWRLPVRQYRTRDRANYMQRNLPARSDFQGRLHLAANLYGMVKNRRPIGELGKLLLRHFREPKDRTLWLQAMANPLEEVAALLSAGMYGLLPVIWHSHEGNRMAMGLLAPGEENQAAFAMAAFDLLGRFGWAVCKRKTCGNLFFLQRQRHNYCSHNCEMAEVMRRRRGRLKRQCHKGAGKKPVVKKNRAGASLRSPQE